MGNVRDRSFARLWMIRPCPMVECLGRRIDEASARLGETKPRVRALHISPRLPVSPSSSDNLPQTVATHKSRRSIPLRPASFCERTAVSACIYSPHARCLPRLACCASCLHAMRHMQHTCPPPRCDDKHPTQWLTVFHKTPLGLRKNVIKAQVLTANHDSFD